MSENLAVFKFENKQVRTEVINGQPMFCLKDVCDVLDITDHKQVLSRLKVGGYNQHPITDRLGRTQEATFINESNLYKAILQSRKPEAEKFQDWITEEVLPAIRQTGGYSVQVKKPLTNMQMISEMALEMDKQNQRLDNIENKMIENKQEVKEQVKQALKAEQVGVFPERCIDLPTIRQKYFQGISESNTSVFLQYIEHPQKEYKKLIQGNEVRISLVFEEMGLAMAYKRLVDESSFINESEKNLNYTHSVLGNFRIKKTR